MFQITNEGDDSFIWSPDLWIFRYVALWQCIKIFWILVGKSRQTSSIEEKTKKKDGTPCGHGLCLSDVMCSAGLNEELGLFMKLSPKALSLDLIESQIYEIKNLLLSVAVMNGMTLMGYHDHNTDSLHS